METNTSPELPPQNSEAILKFELLPGFGDQDVEMSKGAQILTVGLINRIPMVWARCKRSEAKVKRKIALLPDGQDFVVKGEMKYLGTVTLVTELKVPPGLVSSPNMQLPQKAAQIDVIHMFDCGETKLEDPPVV